MTQRRLGYERVSLSVLSLVLLSFLLLPLASLLISGLQLNFFDVLLQPQTLPALRLSLWTTTCAVVIIFVLGTPLSFLLSQSNSNVSRYIQTLVYLPVVLPPAVAGVALLSAFGRHGLVSSFLGSDSSLAFTATAVILAEIFVAGPLFLQAALGAFSLVDRDLIAVARTMGAGPWSVFLRVALPLSRPGLKTGLGLCAARALGEFGATLMFAGNLPGSTQTLPLTIYTALETDLDHAQALSILLLLLSALILGSAHWFTRKRSVQPVLVSEP